VLIDEYVEFEVNGYEVFIVDMLIGWVYLIENVGDIELMIIFWVYELFDFEYLDIY